MKVLVYMYDGMADFEITFLLQLLVSECKKELEIVSDKLGVVTSGSGVQFNITKTLMEVDVEEIEGIIIPGGGLQNLDNKLIEIIRYLNKNNKLLAAICFGPWILAKAGVLEGRKYTTSISEWTKEHEALLHTDNPFPSEGYLSKRVVRDKHIITATGLAFVDFAIEVCDYYGMYSNTDERTAYENNIKGNE